jgi:cytochrome P450
MSDGAKSPTPVVELHDYFVPRIEDRRREPTDDLLSIMVNTEVDGEPPLTTEELLPYH